VGELRGGPVGKLWELVPSRRPSRWIKGSLGACGRVAGAACGEAVGARPVPSSVQVDKGFARRLWGSCGGEPVGKLWEPVPSRRPSRWIKGSLGACGEATRGPCGEAMGACGK